ncbi:MAG: DUF4245 domain-containing protein [Actinomycetia bacterium]|nr:DUF4245 domain-containing protein [Actinomycetes bacterium]MCH9800859.1 DUF4245 domain-containing protein [Actinomycetes bacterium]
MSEPAVAEAPAPSDKHSPLRKTVGDIIRSMGVVAAIIAVVLLITWRPGPDPVREVAAAPVAQQVAAAVDFILLYPELPEGWRATTARFEPSEQSGDDPVWFNGWVSPQEEFVAVVQSEAENDRFIAEQTVGGTEASELPSGLNPAVNGWQPYVSSDGTQRSFVLQEDDVTTIVTGTLEWSELADFAATLQPVETPGAKSSTK